MTDEATGGTTTDSETDGSSRSVLRASYGRTLRTSESFLLRSYAVISALVGVFIVLLVVLGMPLWIAETEGQTALNMIGRALLPLVGLAIIAPLAAPVLYASKNRRVVGGDRRADAALGLVGYLFVASVYLALVISAPADARGDPPALIAPLVEFFYGLPPLAGFAPPVAGAVAIVVVQRWALRRTKRETPK